MARRILNADAPLPARRRSFYGAEPDRFRRHRFLDTVLQMHPSRICSNCGYDLTGLPSDRCPECGANDADRALSRRAQAWSDDPRLWLGMPIAIYTTLILGWCATISIATGADMGGVGSYIGLFAVPLVIGLFLHAIAWTATGGQRFRHRTEGRLWWLTLPALHVAWLVWPITIIAVELIVSPTSLANATDRIEVIFVVSLFAPCLWRLGWVLASRWTQLPARPLVRHWIAAFVIGIPATFCGFVLIAALHALGV